MKMIANIMTVLVRKCQKARPTDKYNCFIYVKMIFTVFLIFNVMSIVILATGNDDIMEWFFKWDGSKYTIIKIIVPVCLYILIGLLFPEKKIVAAEIDDIQGRKSFNYYIIYVLLTVILAVISAFIRR